MPRPSRSPPPLASTSLSGLVSTGTQTFGGFKTFSGDVDFTGALTQNGAPVGGGGGGAAPMVARFSGSGFSITGGDEERLGWTPELDEGGAFTGLNTDTGHGSEVVMLAPGLYRVDVLVALSDASASDKLNPEIAIVVDGTVVATLASDQSGSFLSAREHSWAASVLFRVPGPGDRALWVNVRALGASAVDVLAAPETLLQLQRLGA